MASVGINSMPKAKAGISLKSMQLEKHPLERSWSIWFYKNDKAKEWDQNLRKVTTFSHVEDFWGLVACLNKPSAQQNGTDICVFKAGVKPMWEDAANKNGGRWLITLNRNERDCLDKYWIETLLCLIGEAFHDNSEQVNGAVVQLRNKGDKLAVWTATCHDEQAILSIGQKIKTRLQVPEDVKIFYQAHSDVSSKNSSCAKARYSV